MQNIVGLSDGTKTVIHFVYHYITGVYDDFQFVNRGEQDDEDRKCKLYPLVHGGRVCHLSIRVVSGDFSGVSTFCISRAALCSAISSLQGAYDTLSGGCRIADYDSDDYLNIQCFQYGQIRINGQLGGSYNDQFMKYAFQTDQTELRVILAELSAGVDFPD